MALVIAQLAATYVGHKYVWGGTPGSDGSGGWDCSSFVNYILGVRFGLSIPGGKYNGLSHGPVASSYNGWNGATTIQRSAIGAGDLCVWSTHIGIALNNSQMVSALNPSLGTLITGIESGGPNGESLTCRRIN
jgi:cell wall-associated NlpC family hydrolase